VSVPCFLLFLCFRKSTQEIFSELDETKSKVPIFPDTRWSPKQRQRRARGQPHHRVARPSPWPRHQVVGPPGPPPDAALPPLYSPRRENPKNPIYFLENILQAATIVVYTYIYHKICLILYLQQISEIDNLTVSWGKVLWLCCMQVPHCYWCKATPQIRHHI
jgi:hypothetical protein